LGTWLATKTFLKKVWTWLKHNWKAPLVILAVLFTWLVLRRRGEAEKIIEIREESYKAQIDVINKIHEEEIAERNKIIKKYTIILDKIEKQYEKEKSELNKKKRKEVKEIVEMYHDKPDELAKKIAERFNIEYVEE